MKIHIRFRAVIAAIIIGASSVCANAATGFVYDNSTTDTGGTLIFTNGQTLGQEIFLDAGQLAAYPYLQSFTYEYYSPNATFSGSVQASVRFYLNNGSLYNGYASPGTMFYDSGWFSIITPQQAVGQTVATLPFSWVNLFVSSGVDPINGAATPISSTSYLLPQNFTIVYSFQGLTGGDVVGLPVFNPPGTGTNYGDYWINTTPGGSPTWALVTNNAGPVGIGQQLLGGSTPVPEPSTLALGALGALLLARSMRRKA